MRAMVLGLSGLLGAAAIAAASYGIRQQYVLGGPGGWDYLTLEPAA